MSSRRVEHQQEGAMSEAWLEELSAEECTTLLRSDEVGRIAVVVDGSPIVLPVNYRLVETPTGPLIAIRTRPGNVIDHAHEVAFEIDGVDRAHHRGWSVLVRGTLHHLDVDAPGVAARFDPAPWLVAGQDAWLVIEPRVVSGRRLQAATLEWAFHASAYL
jgi:nitroimidazol reductase NimA-like FMN-containing flavoprotein (pyridoxamine 5'-phosphate oxidase superfamily)